MQALCESLVALALQQGADGADCLARTSEGISAGVYEGQLESFQKSQVQGIGLRVIQQGRVGYAYTEQVEEAEKIVSQALSVSQISDVDEYACIFDGACDACQQEAALPPFTPGHAQEVVEAALALYHEVIHLPHIKNTQSCSAEWEQHAVFFANSHGVAGSASRRECAVFVDAVAKIGDWTDSGWAFEVGHTLKDLSLSNVAAKAQQEAVKYHGAGRAKSGRYPVVILNEAMNDLLGAFSPVFSAERAQKGLSLLKGKQGQRIANANVTLIDAPSHPVLGPRLPFDGEGVPTRAVTLVKEGVLQTLLYSLSAAKQDGVDSTGHGRRGYSSQVSIAPYTLSLLPGQESLESLCQQAGQGVLVCEVSGLHAGVNDVSGDFSLLCKGNLIENGRLGQPIEQLVVSGNFFALLSQVQALGNDVFYSVPSTSCFACPSVLIKQLMIASE